MASILGNRVVRVEDPRLLTSGGVYVEDVPASIGLEATWVHFVRSTFAHGRIKSIDVDEARSMPGVLGVFTGDELDLPVFPHVLPVIPAGCERPLLARGVVRFVGEPVVAVVAETRAQAVDASEQVIVDIEPLPAVLDLDDALADATLLHPAIGTNTYLRSQTPSDKVDFSGCEVVRSFRIASQRLQGAPMEPRSGLAYWDGDTLVHWSSCQGAHPTRDVLSKLYGLPHSQVRVVVPDVGGGFGVKSRTIGEELTLGWLARAVGRPVRYTETRNESMMAMPQGRGQRLDVTIGGTRDGKVLAYHVDVVQDAGAYPLMGSFLPTVTQRMLPGVYDLPACSGTGVSVATNRISVTAYRGAGRPEATHAIERSMDVFADAIGMDPAEVRRRNLAPRFTEPWTTAVGTTYDVGDYPEALERVLRAANYDTLRAEQASRHGSRVEMGIGIAAYVEITAANAGSEHASIRLLSGGRARVLIGAAPQGQGHDTTWKMIIAEQTGLAFDAIDVVHGDTALVPAGGLTVGSRSVQIAGSALHVAATRFVDEARERAADLLEAASADVELGVGGFHVKGTPSRTVSWAQLAELPTPLDVVSDFVAPASTFPFGVNVAVVDVDTETGLVTLRRVIAVDDVGTAINPLLVDGQLHGGIGQGVAQALLEEMHYDADGNPLTASFADYPVISAAELPFFELVHMETPTWVNPLGAKGAGESGVVGSTPAVINAVVDALRPFGVVHLDAPLTPQRVWEAMQR